MAIARGSQVHLVPSQEKQWPLKGIPMITHVLMKIIPSDSSAQYLHKGLLDNLHLNITGNDIYQQYYLSNSHQKVLSWYLYTASLPAVCLGLKQIIKYSDY